MPPAERTLPIRWDLTGEDAIVQGATWNRYIALDYLNPNTGQLVVWNTTGYTARMMVWSGLDGASVLSLTTDNGRLQVGGPDYTVQLPLTPEATKDLADWGLGTYSLEIEDPYGHVYRIHDGRCALRTGDVW